MNPVNTLETENLQTYPQQEAIPHPDKPTNFSAEFHSEQPDERTARLNREALAQKYEIWRRKAVDCLAIGVFIVGLIVAIVFTALGGPEQVQWSLGGGGTTLLLSSSARWLFRNKSDD